MRYQRPRLSHRRLTSSTPFTTVFQPGIERRHRDAWRLVAIHSGKVSGLLHLPTIRSPTERVHVVPLT